ncbi:phage terminase large subunit family protein [bacterium]|nr:phage terminase large subunit family protein [bacterium]
MAQNPEKISRKARPSGGNRKQVEQSFLRGQLVRLRRVAAAAIRPPQKLRIDEWADRYRMLPSETSAEPGPWRTDRMPFLREIMRELSPDSPAEEVVFMKGAQVGASEVGLNLMFYVIDHAPGPMMYMIGTLSDARRFVTNRVETAGNLMPRIRGKIGSRTAGAKKRETILEKKFPGGLLVFVGANSPSSLREVSIRYLVNDEVDGYPQDLLGEGDPVELSDVRTRNQPRRKKFRLSTPLEKQTSRIEPLFLEGDQRYYYVPCPYCGHMQRIEWKRIKWEDGDPSTAALLCESGECGALIPEGKKQWMLARGEWRATNPDGLYPSFHLNSFYSPFFKYAEGVAKFLKAKNKNDEKLLQVFVNTALGETWDLENRVFVVSDLLQLREPYEAQVPAGVILLTAGVDVQHDRLEVEVVGWGRGEESWSIDYKVFAGDTEYETVWQDLDRYLQQTFTASNGDEVHIAGVAVDSSDRSKVVYSFCRGRAFRRIYAVKGKEGAGKGFVQRPKNPNDEGVLLFILFVDEIKQRVYSHLATTDPLNPFIREDDGARPGYCHFPDDDPPYNERYFKMLTSEKREFKTFRGRKRPVWVLPSGARNEALDCRVYARAMLEILGFDLDAYQGDGPFDPSFRKMQTGRRRRGVVSKGVKG